MTMPQTMTSMRRKICWKYDLQEEGIIGDDYEEADKKEEEDGDEEDCKQK